MKSCDKARYRNNGFLSIIGLCMRHGCCRTIPCGHVARPERANSVSYVIVTLLTDWTALQMQFKMYIGTLCIFATSGGVHALT